MAALAAATIRRPVGAALETTEPVLAAMALPVVSHLVERGFPVPTD